MSKCVKCGAEINGTEKFCSGCGARIFVCPQCGAPYNEGDKFCNECGCKLTTDIPSVDEVVEQPVIKSEVQSNGDKNKMLNVIIGILIALGVAGGGFYFYQQNVVIPREKAIAQAKVEAEQQEQKRIAAEELKKKEAAAKEAEEKAKAKAAEEASRITRDDARKCFQQYIGLLNDRNFGAAYGKYSQEWQNETDYKKWSSSYNTTIDQRVDIKNIDIISNSRARLSFVLYARDRKNGNVVNTVFSGRWDVIKDSNGGLYLDNPEVHLDRSY